MAAFLLSIWAHWGIFRRSDAPEGVRTVSRSRLVLMLALFTVTAAGGVAMAVTNSFVVVMGILGAAIALFLMGCVPAYVWHISKTEQG